MAFNRKPLDLPAVDSGAVRTLIDRWRNADGAERANYQLFLTELCALLHLPQPEPSSQATEHNAYVFERRVDIANPDGSANRGFIDLYRRGAFVCEAKQSGKDLDSRGWDKAMLRAFHQAANYVRALPAAEGRPPFIVVTDVGRSIEVYAEFSRSGGNYTPYPDPGHHRIRLDDLTNPDIQDRLRRLWLDPDSLDPGKFAAQVTREVSARLAELARQLERDGFEIERVAHFLKRCLFTMFAEDVQLIPEYGFTSLLKRLVDHPEHFVDSMNSLWHAMNDGGFEGQLMAKLPRFNGGLFDGIDPIPLKREQIALLISAAEADWRYVEPAIFGTLLERALDPRERHKLGAHYTPRAYVERLVLPTLIEPLREEWNAVQVAAETWLQQDKPDKAVAELRAFHHQLCQLRILDPACGSGNFLYVALEHLKRLEGEVLNLISDLSAGQIGFETEGLTVDPHQFLGLEINPRAAAIAEIVLWIGYLQWHFRIHGTLNLPEPILRDFHNIEHRDALIEYDSREVETDDQGQPVTIWDGIGYKPSAATGELVPDESARIPVYRYHNPRQTDWPEADYIVGNPPFIGNKRMRLALGDGYVEAVRDAYKGKVPESADFVMYWWQIAAEKSRRGEIQRFGLITTNSLRQTFNRKVIENFLSDSDGLASIAFAIADHPWVDNVDGAAVRISMTVGTNAFSTGAILNILEEKSSGSGEVQIRSQIRTGIINPDLTIGANTNNLRPLISNSGISNRGVIPNGAGFVITVEKANELGRNKHKGLTQHIRPYRNGKDIVQFPRGVLVIDLFPMDIAQVQSDFPELYQWMLERIKPEREQKRDPTLREFWWLHRRNNETMRASLAGLSRYIVTPQTCKHRIFTFLDQEILADDKLITVGLYEPVYLGILSSRVHTNWSMRTGSWLGVGNDSVYNKGICFDAFPFPELNTEYNTHIGDLAERLDAHRKRQQAEFPGLKLTDLYNVLEKLRAEVPLTDKERTIHQQGLVSILRELHDELDRAVFAAYGWDDLADQLVGRPGATTPLPDKPAEQAQAEEEMLTRLVALNQQRAAEETRGLVRWLRPEYQAPDSTQGGMEIDEAAQAGKTETVSTGAKPTWPKDIKDQIRALLDGLANGPLDTDTLAAQFKRKPVKSVTQILSAMEALGKVSQENGLWSA